MKLQHLTLPGKRTFFRSKWILIAIFLITQGCKEIETEGTLADIDVGLVAYFPLDGNSIDVVNGLAPNIEQGEYTEQGAASGEGAYLTGNYGYYYGDADRFNFGPNTPFSISFWCKTDLTAWSDTTTSSGSYQLLIHKGTGTLNDDLPVSFEVSFRRGIENSNANNQFIEAGFSVAPGLSENSNCYSYGNYALSMMVPLELLHVVIQRNSNRLRLFINGALVAERTFDVSSACVFQDSSPLQIGGDINDSNKNYYGVIDEVRIYNRFISPLEVYLLYNSNR